MANTAFIIGAKTQGLDYAENDAALMRECLEKYDYEIFEPPVEKNAIQAGAACQAVKRPQLLYILIDFNWWQKNASVEQLASEQLEKLSRDRHGWSIVRTETMPVFPLMAPADVPDEFTREMELGLTFTVSLSLQEKQKVAAKYQELSVEQINNLLNVFREEQLKFALLPPTQQLKLNRLSEIANTEKNIGALKNPTPKPERHKEDCAVADEPWHENVWYDFLKRVWTQLSEDQQNALNASFPQSQDVKEAMTGNKKDARPSLAFTVAACQFSKLYQGMHVFVDFDWWQTKATPEQQEGEQLAQLTRDHHDWGIIRSVVSEKLKLNPHPDVSEEIKIEIEKGLSWTISLSADEKRKVVDSWLKLSEEQIVNLRQIFRQEQIKFALIGPEHQQQLGLTVEKIWEDQ